jgi:hypothetical protein
MAAAAFPGTQGECSSRPSPGAEGVGGPNLVRGWGARDNYGGSHHRPHQESTGTQDDAAMTQSELCVTPPQSPPPSEKLPALLPGPRRVRAAICKFTLQDFTPGAPEPNPYLRQAVGEYLPWLHNCGEETCPFTEPPAHLYRMSLEIGQPLPNSELSPGDHIRVDKRAFQRDVFVKVKLVLLGYDPRLWGDLEFFSGLVVDRYYQEVSGTPMFSVDFGGSIGHREVRVMDSVVEERHGNEGSAQRSLDFTGVSSGSNAGGQTLGDIGSNDCTVDVGNLNPLDPNAPLLPDSDSDLSWTGDFVDFQEDDEDSGHKDNGDGDAEEDPLAELGMYDPDEDLRGWTFRETFDDTQWQEAKLTLLGLPRRFTGPLPGATNPGNARQSSNCQQYFRRFWPDTVLSRIVEETNR